jgi:hypothetical protein
MRTYIKRGMALAIFAAVGLVSGRASAAVFQIRSDAADYEANSTGITSTGVSGDLRIGTIVISPNARITSAILPFQLPALPAGEVVTGATLDVLTSTDTVTNTLRRPTASENGDLYGLPFDATPVDVTAARYFSGPNDTTVGVTKLQDNYLVAAHANTAQRVISVDISAYLNSLYAAGAQAGDFAILRISYDPETVDTTILNRYRFRAQGTSTTANPEADQPLLTITTGVVPEPSTAGVLLGVAALALFRRCRQTAAGSDATPG